MDKADDGDFCPTRHTLLLRVINNKDEKSWEEFVFYYKKFIYLLTRRLGLGHHDGEEIVQQVLTQLWKKLPDFEYKSGSRFRSFLYTMTYNFVMNFHNKSQSEQKRIEKAIDLEAWNPEVSPKNELSSRIEKEWKKYLSNLAFENVKEKFSENVIRVFEQTNKGVPVSQISEEEGMPSNTVYVYTNRVTKKLKEEISRLKQELE